MKELKEHQMPNFLKVLDFSSSKTFEEIGKKLKKSLKEIKREKIHL